VSHVRAVLLDFGGTLDSDGLHWSTQFAASFAAAGHSLDRARLDRAFLAADRAIAQDARGCGAGFADYAEDYASRMLAFLGRKGSGAAHAIAEHFLGNARSHLRRNAALLAAAHPRFRFAIVSNFTQNLPRLVQEAGLAGTVDAVVCSAIEGIKKPDPAMFRLALARLGAAADEAAMIGDSLGNDIVPAKQLGLTTIWLCGDRSYNGGETSAADHTVHDLPEAFAALQAQMDVKT
jgi:putative hydrolase of the HAD superfamily